VTAQPDGAWTVRKARNLLMDLERARYPVPGPGSPPRCAPSEPEVTDRMLIARPWHLRAVLEEYVAHYNQHRPHCAMDLRPPGGGDTPVADLAIVLMRVTRSPAG